MGDRVKRVTLVQCEMLYRVALAGYFTSPTMPSRYSVHRRRMALLALERKGLIERNPASGGIQRLTESARTNLHRYLDAAQIQMIERLEARRILPR